jgi:hypothetical protein
MSTRLSRSSAGKISASISDLADQIAIGKPIPARFRAATICSTKHHLRFMADLRLRLLEIR